MALRVIDMDECPKTDNPVIKGDCSGCEHYAGFEVSNGLPCIKCQY